VSVSVQVGGSASLVSATAVTYYALSASSTPVNGGTTSPSGANSYPAGATVQVTAKPAYGFYLSYWLLDGANVGNMNPITVAMNQSHELVAVFALASYAGGVSPAPGAVIALSESPSATTAPGSVIALSESPLESVGTVGTV